MRAEHAVTEALLTLAEADTTLPLPSLVGQRYGALLAALGARDDEAQAIEAITTFQRHDELRSFLCHGLTKVMLDRAGGWHVALTLLTLRRKNADRRHHLLDETGAALLATDLRREQATGGKAASNCEPTVMTHRRG